MHMIAGVLQYVAVASFAEAWIENVIYPISTMQWIVASFAEAWIENSTHCNPAWYSPVASFAEAWIEKFTTSLTSINFLNVASFAEAWIEKSMILGFVFR